MRKMIKKVSPAAFGHLMLEFEDGVKQLVHRGDHEAHQPKAGDLWPPDGHEQVTSGPQTEGRLLLRISRQLRHEARAATGEIHRSLLDRNVVGHIYRERKQCDGPCKVDRVKSRR
jgi:hypothetical protein